MRYCGILLVLALFSGSETTLSGQTFTYRGIGLETNLDSLAAATFPNSRHNGTYLTVAPEDRSGFIGNLNVGHGRVRIGFQVSRSREYPTCSAIQEDLVRRFGPPDEVLETSEEAMRVSNRYWRSPTETMYLACFRGDDGLFAEALLIYPRDQSFAAASSGTTSAV